MSQLRIRFTGMCTLAQSKVDSTVDVLFPGYGVNGHVHSHGHVGHFPLLSVPHSAVATTTGAGPFPRRVAGRPIHLYMFEKLRVLIGGKVLNEPVTLGTAATFPNPSPDKEADWQDYRYILAVADVFPKHELDRSTILGPVVELRGGRLTGDIPQTHDGTRRWNWSDPTDKTSFITDVAKWEHDVGGDAVTLQLQYDQDGTKVAFEVQLRPGVEADIWVCHDPVPVGPRQKPVTVKHLEALAQHLKGARLPPDPPTITLTSSLNPDSATCPPNFAVL